MAPAEQMQPVLDQAHAVAQTRRFDGPSDAEILQQLEDNAARLTDIGMRLHDTCERIAALKGQRS